MPPANSNSFGSGGNGGAIGTEIVIATWLFSNGSSGWLNRTGDHR